MSRLVGGEPEDMVVDARIARMTLELQAVDDDEELASSGREVGA